jgi:pyruvate dehydrogenase E1 component beta subunit
VTTPDTQIPYSPALEKQLYPNRTTIAAAVRRVTGEFTTPEAIATGAPR